LNFDSVVRVNTAAPGSHPNAGSVVPLGGVVDPKSGVDVYRSLLPQSTLDQRKGRTGRTSDGVFIQVIVRNASLSEAPDFTVFDYLMHAGPAAPAVLPHIPQSLVLVWHPEALRPLVRALADVPGLNYAHYDFALMMYRGLEHRNIPFDTLYSLIFPTSKLGEWRLIRNKPTLDRDLLGDDPIPVDQTLIRNPFGSTTVDVSTSDTTGWSTVAAASRNLVLSSEVPNIKGPHVLIRGTGVATVSALRALQGLIWTHYRVAIDYYQLFRVFASWLQGSTNDVSLLQQPPAGHVRDFAEHSLRFRVVYRTPDGDLARQSPHRIHHECIVQVVGYFPSDRFDYYGHRFPIKEPPTDWVDFKRRLDADEFDPDRLASLFVQNTSTIEDLFSLM